MYSNIYLNIYLFLIVSLCYFPMELFDIENISVIKYTRTQHMIHLCIEIDTCVNQKMLEKKLNFDFMAFFFFFFLKCRIQFILFFFINFFPLDFILHSSFYLMNKCHHVHTLQKQKFMSEETKGIVFLSNVQRLFLFFSRMAVILKFYTNLK